MDEPTPIAPEAQDPCPHCGQPVGDAWLVCAWCGTQIAAPAELPVGATLADGRYQVIGIIGRGGFGITYEVGDTRLKRRVAVKELFPESAVRHGSMVLTPPQARASFRAARDRFLREARVLARFTHPGIVRVYEVFEEHGTAYLVMERLSGRTLVDVLRARNEPFTEAEVVDVAARVAAALRPVHAAGVLHRDVNPSNVMLTEHGRIVVIDFGLARDFDQGQTMGMTRMVTPGYAPLEQYRGEGRFGPTTDIYGLAATCYRLATGRVPVAAVERDAGGDLPAPHRLNPEISKPVSDAILDGLELEPAHRPQDLDAFLARLGVRWLPDSPRSVLLGSVGAEPADLAAQPDGPGTETIAGLSTPTAAEPIFDPGPAVAAPPPAPPPPAPVVEPASRLATELVGRPSPPSTTPFGAAPPPPPAPVDPVDEDATFVPDRAPLDGDRTWTPGDHRGADATRGAELGWGGVEAPEPLALPAEPAASRPRLVTVPFAILAVAVGSAAPLLAIGVLVLVVLPVLATVGDAAARRQRAERGFAEGRAERLPTGVVVPSRFVRNLVTSVVRTSPIVGISAVFLGCWYALDQTSLPQGIMDMTLRLIGGGAVAMLLLGAREGSSRFRSGLGIDQLVAGLAPDGRVTERLLVTWLLIAIGVAAALWLTPDAFPLPVTAPAWIDEIAWPADGPPWLAMGLSRIQEGAWLLPDSHRDAELAERADLLDEQRDAVFAALDGTEAASAEALAAVLAWERTHAPTLADRPVDPAQHPLEAAGRRTQEDLVLMVPHGDHYHLDAAVLCFPSHWRLLDKLGGSATAIHGPVPRYETDLAEKVDRFLDRLRPDVIVARRNWSVHGDDALHAPDPPVDPAPVDVEAVPAALWLRSERQTLRRLPETGAVLFTIRVQQSPFAAFADHPAAAHRLAARLEAQPDELTEMNGLAPHRDAVSAWLRRLPETPAGGDRPPS